MVFWVISISYLRKNNWIHIIRSDLSLHVELHKISEPADKNTSSNLEIKFDLSWKYKIMHKIRLFWQWYPFLPPSPIHLYSRQCLLLCISKKIATTERSLQSRTPPGLCQSRLVEWVTHSSRGLFPSSERLRELL